MFAASLKWIRRAHSSGRLFVFGELFFLGSAVYWTFRDHVPEATFCMVFAIWCKLTGQQFNSDHEPEK